ncbi:MAG: HNH endonuclease [Candidatus Marinimicrobia bacterium]|nr:HNH endonuclease [Candidatus Neomarinimicrobiota bacterium]
MNTEAQPTEQHTKACIFCFRTDLETEFSEEHIIPQSIGGRLVLDQVCKECNDQLGHQVDVDILKIPEILKALEFLNIPYNREGILRSYYDVQGKSPEGPRNIRATASGFEPLPQQMPDGSLLTPDDRAIEDLTRRVMRDERLIEAGLTPAQIQAELKNLIRAYNQSNPGDVIDWPALGVKLVRRQGKTTIRIQSRKTPQIHRLMAKIAYEFLFFIGWREFLINRQVAEPLFNAIQGETDDNPAYFLRLDPLSNEFVPIHTIELHTHRGMTEVYILLFGRIGYRVTTMALLPDYLKFIGDQYGIDDIIGIHFQQRLDGELGFHAITADGEYIWLGQKE